MNEEGDSTLTIRKSNRVTDGFKGVQGYAVRRRKSLH